MEILKDNYLFLVFFAVITFLYFLPEIKELFNWISQRAKESQQIGELSRKITEIEKYDDSLQNEVEQEIQNEIEQKILDKLKS